MRLPCFCAIFREYAQVIARVIDVTQQPMIEGERNNLLLLEDTSLPFESQISRTEANRESEVTLRNDPLLLCNVLVADIFPG
jgi:hypothetical protein